MSTTSYLVNDSILQGRYSVCFNLAWSHSLCFPFYGEQNQAKTFLEFEISSKFWALKDQGILRKGNDWIENYSLFP